jgi:hypothetical protein
MGAGKDSCQRVADVSAVIFVGSLVGCNIKPPPQPFTPPPITRTQSQDVSMVCKDQLIPSTDKSFEGFEVITNEGGKLTFSFDPSTDYGKKVLADIENHGNVSLDISTKDKCKGVVARATFPAEVISKTPSKVVVVTTSSEKLNNKTELEVCEGVNTSFEPPYSLSSPTNIATNRENGHRNTRLQELPKEGLTTIFSITGDSIACVPVTGKDGLTKANLYQLETGLNDPNGASIVLTEVYLEGEVVDTHQFGRDLTTERSKVDIKNGNPIEVRLILKSIPDENGKLSQSIGIEIHNSQLGDGGKTNDSVVLTHNGQIISDEQIKKINKRLKDHNIPPLPKNYRADQPLHYLQSDNLTIDITRNSTAFKLPKTLKVDPGKTDSGLFSHEASQAIIAELEQGNPVILSISTFNREYEEYNYTLQRKQIDMIDAIAQVQSLAYSNIGLTNKLNQEIAEVLKLPKGSTPLDSLSAERDIAETY